jgi:hypothetical protein
MATNVSRTVTRESNAQLWSGIALSLLLVVTAGAALAEGTKLEGNVQETGVLPSTDPMPAISEPMPVPVLKPKKTPQHGQLDESFGSGTMDRMNGAAKDDALNGKVDTGGSGAPLTGKLDPKTGRIQGFAAKDDPNLQAGAAGEDPDVADAELMVEWDRWRNRFLHAIQSGMQESLNNPSETTLRWDPVRRTMVSAFPMGTIAWFSCQVTPELKIIHIKLLHSSGHPAYDKAVLDAIDSLQGSSVLRYPRKSRRLIVTQTAGIKTAEQAEYRNFHFGDVERQRVPRRENF